jgi:xanthine dehydrogenase YagR molybdenum-binding subunit
MATDYIGKATPRVDGRKKVTGQAKYAAEFNTPDLLHGIVVSSAIARGKITSIDASEALALPGVIEVFTHENTPSLAWFDLSYKDMDSPPGEPFRPLHKAEIQFSMQPVALVVAESLELAKYASHLVKVEYEVEEHQTSLTERMVDHNKNGKGLRAGFEAPSSIGNFEKAWENAECQVEVAYTHEAEHHNPMEMHASMVIYEPDGKLTIYDKTQGVLNSRHYVSMVFGINRKKIRVLSPFVGGAFGSGLRPQYQLFMATLAATQLKRSVKVELTRPQMFSFGHRPITLQHLKLGASKNGKLDAVYHSAYAETSRFESYNENVVIWAPKLYACKNVKETYRLVPLDVYTPLDMRAPGGATGMYALDSAMDELAYSLNIDPLELRLINYAEEEQNGGKPFSSKTLRQCYEKGAELFQWNKRKMEPRSMKEGHQLIGWGMATGIWDADQVPIHVQAILSDEGTLTVSSASADIGTGTYTIVTQVAAETLGLPMDQVEARLGDSSLPFAPIEGGSSTAASICAAVQTVCQKIGKKLLKEARKMENSPLDKAKMKDVHFADGYIVHTEEPERKVSISEILSAREVKQIKKKYFLVPNMIKQNKYGRQTHSAVFAEVKVDEDFGTIKVTRIVSVIDGGRILNRKTAHSQILGGVVWGISMALEEHSFMDHTFGRFINHDLAEYHVAVNADMPDIEIDFAEEEDTIVSSVGAKGIGEIGIVGVAAAIGNAVFHATGKRIRSLPITLDKAMD